MGQDVDKPGKYNRILRHPIWKSLQGTAVGFGERGVIQFSKLAG